jgi:glycosyltransferase involved in cell wall biosynthesis
MGGRAGALCGEAALRICVVPQVHGVGGMVSFKQRLLAVLEEQGIEICQDLSDVPYRAVLVVGGTRQLGGLWRAWRAGIPVVQRLDGMNWLHRLPVERRGAPVSLRHYLRAEYGNWILKFIRNHLATRIVYQSEFVRGWWERQAGKTAVPTTVIYNGVDLGQFSPHGAHERPADRLRILLVEGSLMGGYEWGLRQAVQLAEGLQISLQSCKDIYPQGVEVMIVGRAAAEVRRYWQEHSRVPLIWRGQAAVEEIPAIDRSAHLFYSADIHPACPNAVIEALACGLPVLAFDTGALPEIVREGAGRVVPYGADPWQLEEPDMPALIQGGVEIALHQDRFREGARQRAEEVFDAARMAERYLEVLVG